MVFEKMDKHSIIAFVIDSESGYRYITQSDLGKWQVTQSTLKKVALENLNMHSKNINIQGSLEGEKYLIIATGDGYDAARILLPELKEYIGSLLNFPFYGAMPNRDFLIFWSEMNTASYYKNTTTQVSLDFKNDAYPITDSIFKITKESMKIIK